MSFSRYFVELVSATAIVSLSIHRIRLKKQWEEEELSLDARTSVLQDILQRLRSGDRIPDDEMTRLRRLARPAHAQEHISGADITVKEMFVGRKRKTAET
ncbi:hypothetical protein BD626DRAFT_543903 [Schizophyllum amplum]|uniref:Uncharacterized protein n=1 Tax=Schizophyllum amplum TaxID=97359 RepID=A0A550CW64_9AGAR|nr:hypothetical protein BD626DRAFT_543903 [Auriculariopsis ampla]